MTNNNLVNFVDYSFHKKFSTIIEQFQLSGKKVLEVGCALSTWLSYFSIEHNMQVTGLDYSEVGCQKEREVLKNHGVQGEIVCGNLFEPPQQLIEQFDLVYSMGVLEHFDDTRESRGPAFFPYSKPGGVVITEIPNMKGLVGAIQKFWGPEIFNKHVPLVKVDLQKAHEQAGYKVHSCEYLMFFNGHLWAPDKPLCKPLKNLKRVVIGICNRLFWGIEKKTSLLPPNSITSPYIICVAQKLKN